MAETPRDLGALSDLATPWCAHVAATRRIADHIAAGRTRLRLDVERTTKAAG